MTSANIVWRKLSSTEAIEFSRQIRHTPNIIGYRPHELLGLENVLIAENKGRAAGMLAYIEASKFIDFKLLIVLQKFRGQGLGSQLFATFMKRFSQTEKPIYTVTRNDVVVRMLERAGFREVGPFGLPLVCLLHQLKMFFSASRAKEYLRKLIVYRGQAKFSYFLKQL